MSATVAPMPPASRLHSPTLHTSIVVRSRLWRWCSSSSLRPAAVVAYLAVLWRIVLAPLLLALFMLKSEYVTTATTFIGSKDAYFAFSFMDPVMTGACNDCDLGCPRAFAILAGFESEALVSRPVYQSLFTATAELAAHGLIDQELTPDALELATEIDAAVDEVVPAATLNVFPEVTECRPLVLDEAVTAATGSKLALATDNVDLALLVPSKLHRCPYWFSSILSFPSVVLSTGGHRVIQTHFQAYYGRCRLRSVNASGVFVDEDCAVDAHWAEYGLMLLNPDDIPVCGTDDLCVHNDYSPLWEYVTSVIGDGTASSSDQRRFLISANVFRLRHADKAMLSALPSVVVIQLLAMGAVSLYQTMAHRRSVLLTQIWAYKCQTGHQQVVYLAQVAYHLFMTSSRYYLGLTTGTLSLESIGNLTLCFFVFSYTLINLLRARTGDQELDRYFRLTWEILQLGTTGLVAALLYIYRHTSLDFIMTYNGELLRKTMARGAELCDLSDSCIVFSVNLVVVLAAVVAALGLIPFVVACVLRRCLHLQRYANSDEVDDAAFPDGRRWSSAPLSYQGIVLGDRFSSKAAKHRTGPLPRSSGAKVASFAPARETDATPRELTTFERHCLGTHFSALFHDCEDFAYVTRRGVRYSSVEAVLLSGYLFHGAHIYRASDLLLLLLARMLPRRLLRSFNFILLRWQIDPQHRTVGFPLACTWLAAGSERVKSARVAPIR